MSIVEWKGVRWTAAHDDLSVPELLTTLKGYGPMEVLEFEKAGCYRGQLSLCLTERGNKEISLYSLEVLGERRKGLGRSALQWLKRTFRGELYVEDSGFIKVENATEESLLFWIKMFREGLVDALECGKCSLSHGLSASDIDRIEEEIKGYIEAGIISARQ